VRPHPGPDPHDLTDWSAAAHTREVTALILAGGKATRLGGVDKCTLELGGASLLDRRVASLAPLCREILLVGAGDGTRLDAAGRTPVRVVPDAPGTGGPLAALLAGMGESSTPWVFATACDMPFIAVDLYRALFSARGGHDLVVPAVSGWYEPLFAFYAASCLPAVRDAVSRGETRIASFYREVRARFVAEDELRELDPELSSFFNVNTPEDLARARELMRRERP
jgi:molybdenum cofactor guanylyltransferase